MAKKKNTKKPVSKRTTRATLDERNERLGKTDAPKPRVKKTKPVITTEPAINTVWREGSAAEFLGDTDPQIVSQVVSKVVSWTPPAPQLTESGYRSVEYTKVNKNFIGSAWEWINFKLDDAKVYWKKNDPITAITDFSFAHPLIFAISFCVVLSAVCIGVLYLNRVFHLF
jgi:hypothetical protein